MRTINIAQNLDTRKKKWKRVATQLDFQSNAAQIVMKSGRELCATDLHDPDLTLWSIPTVPNVLFSLFRSQFEQNNWGWKVSICFLLCAECKLFVCKTTKDLRFAGATFYFSLAYILDCGSFGQTHTPSWSNKKREVTSVNRIPTTAAPEKNLFSLKFVTDCVACVGFFFNIFIQSSAAFSVSREDRSAKCAYYFIALWSHAAIFRRVASPWHPVPKLLYAAVCISPYYWRLAPRTGIPFYHFSRSPTESYFSFCRFRWARKDESGSWPKFKN